MYTLTTAKAACVVFYGYLVLLQDVRATNQLSHNPEYSYENVNYIIDDDLSSLNRLLKPRRGGEGSRQRVKRKVISRGGHYIVRGKMGGSPYGSGGTVGGSPWGSGGTTGGSSIGYNWRKPVRKTGSSGWIPTGIAVEAGAGGTRYSSSTLKISPKPTPERKDRKKISRTLKAEIAQYNLRHGTSKTILRFSPELGRQIKEKVIEKITKRYIERKRKHTRQ